jgi:alanyl-tRNA synthetase
MPSNEGRGYTLRRIIRRAIRFGQVLGLKDPFLHRVCTEVIETMGLDYNELVSSKSFIEGVVENEEKRFADTLHYSMKVLDEEINRLKSKGTNTIPGEVVFRLYDTYGLSADIVEDVAREEQLNVDMEGFDQAMSRQRAISQESWKGSGEEAIPEAFRNLLARGAVTTFLGYETLGTDAIVDSVLIDGQEVVAADEESSAEIILDKTPFYGKAGGQAGDSGLISKNGARFIVNETLKYGRDLIVHKGFVKQGSFSVGDSVHAEVDIEKRKATALNHTATHLLHAALREMLGDHVKQAGSLVSPDRLRFDFSHFAQVDPQKLKQVEDLVNKHIRDNMPIKTNEMSREKALETGAMAIFEERYGESVRLVKVGNGVSMELCGGTHTEKTGDIGLFRIVSEGAVAANVRRIEAVTGKAALEYDQNLDHQLKQVASLLKVTPDNTAGRLERILKELKEKEREIESLKAKLLSEKTSDQLSEVKEIAGLQVITLETEADSTKELREAADRMKDRLGSGIILLGARKGDRVMLICVVTKDLTNRFNAGDIIKMVSGIVGGSGGGRADMAQGGGTEPHNLDKAFEALKDLVKGI